MLILSRFLLSHYCKALFLCVLAFISVLLATQLEEIAHIAALGASCALILRFTLYQVPLVLPLTISISCLIAATALTRSLVSTHELTALRAGGISLFRFLTPLLLLSMVIGFGNFLIVSELATTTHLHSKAIKTSLRTVNPLLFLRSKQLAQANGLYFEAFGHSQRGLCAEQVVIAAPNQRGAAPHLVLADELKANDTSFWGKGVTMISPMGDGEGPVPLLIDNIEEMEISAVELSHLFQKQVWVVKNDHLRLWPLVQKRQVASTREERAFCDAELARRFSLAAAPVTFTLLGIGLSISAGRGPPFRRIVHLIALVGLYLAAYFGAKQSDSPFVAIAAFLLPHPLLIGCSLSAIRKRARGEE